MEILLEKENVNKIESNEQNEQNKGKKRKGIKNVKKNNDKNKEKINIIEDKGDELQSLKESLICSYKKKIAVYFFACSFIMTFNWYMMTSFCSIYINTGTKLLINSIISLMVSFIIPLVFGLISTPLGFLAYKTENKIIIKLYTIINYIM